MEDKEFFKIPSTEEIQAIKFGRTVSSIHARRISNMLGSFRERGYSDFLKRAVVLSNLLGNSLSDKEDLIQSEVELPEELAEAKSTIKRRAKLLSEYLSGDNGLIPQIRSRRANELIEIQVIKLKEMQEQWMSLCANENISTEQFEK